MNNTIRTWNDLLEEEQRLTLLVAWHKDRLKADVQEIKKHLSPVAKVASFIGHLSASSAGKSLLGAGAGLGAGMLAEKLMLTKPLGWLARKVSPFLLKNIAGGLVKRLIDKKISH